MKIAIFAVLTSAILCGCVATYGINESRIEDEYEKYATGLIIKQSDGFWSTTGKSCLRGLLFPFGCEVFIMIDKQEIVDELYEDVKIERAYGKTYEDVKCLFNGISGEEIKTDDGYVVKYKQIKGKEVKKYGRTLVNDGAYLKQTNYYTLYFNKNDRLVKHNLIRTVEKMEQ